LTAAGFNTAAYGKCFFSSDHSSVSSLCMPGSLRLICLLIYISAAFYITFLDNCCLIFCNFLIQKQMNIQHSTYIKASGHSNNTCEHWEVWNCCLFFFFHCRSFSFCL